MAESVHRVDAVVADLEGPLLVWGEAERPVIARSALKFVQALPLLQSGAADRYDLSNQELALACASHSGEPAHVEAVRAWLARLGLDESALECGAAVPIGKQAAIDHHRAGAMPAAVLHCCSGKHAGFISVARHLGHDHAGYIEPDHPVQRLVTAAVAELTGHPLADQTPGRDGCGIPTYGIPLSALAAAMARLVSPGQLEPSTAAPARRLSAAVVGQEFWISGTDRHEMALAAEATEPVLAKVGAEGVFMAALPARGIGIALKAVDGAERAANAAVSAILARLGALTPCTDVAQLGLPIRNAAGAEVGRMTVDHSAPVVDRLQGA